MRIISSIVMTLILTSTLGACSVFQVYTTDVPQGTPITQRKAQAVQIGMSQEQVLNLLGTPALRDTLNPNRWDYIYDYKAGTDGRRAGKPNTNNARQYLKVYFDANGRVVNVDGIASLPTVRQF